MVMKNKRVRLVGRTWLDDWKGLEGTVIQDYDDESFLVKLDRSPLTYGRGEVHARTGDVEVIG
jgi:hypothetical protein